MFKPDSGWGNMENSLTQSESSTEEVLSKVKAFNTRYEEHNEWQTKAEQTLQDCLPIEMNAERLEEQQAILESLNSEVLEHKRIPEELDLQASEILDLSKEGTGVDLLEKVKKTQETFSQLEDAVAESCELCEEARNDAQVFEELEKKFIKLIANLKEGFDVLKNKPKRPVGNVQETINEHTDYCMEVESKVHVFNKMYDFGRRSCKRYPPSQQLVDSLNEKFKEWEEFIGSLVTRWDHYVGIKESWKEFESIVKDFLEWVMAEGKSFSKDVTTLGGEKGVFDHMKTCEAFKNSLTNKDKLLKEITTRAEKLQEEDGEKPNGTKDVDSRLNDVSIHWNSVCQLLSETLQTLDAVYKKLVLINDITASEQEWLNEMGSLIATKRTTHGVVNLVVEEVELFKGYMQQFEDHRPSFVVILETEEFVLEHTSCHDHEDIKNRVRDTIKEFETLEESGKVYVGKLEKSIPLWEKFNEQKAYLLQWVQQSQQTYDGKLQSGNATTTRKSLETAEVLYEDIQSHLENVELFNELVKELSTLCVDGDKDFVVDNANSLTSDVETLKEGTEERKDLLESRMEGWRVFPIEAATDVQEFLEAVSKEIEEDEDDFDEFSADELLGKLERLESLQKQQSRKRNSISTLDSSYQSDKVRKAMEKNPDLSQERTSLLEGWSSKSSKLTTKLELLRLKATMVVKMEQEANKCTNSLERYQDHLSIPLPHSVALQKMQPQWQETEKTLRMECVANVDELSVTHNDYDEDNRVQVPTRLKDLVNDVKSKHQKLLEKGLEMSDHISQRVQDWEHFFKTMTSLSEWLQGAHVEMKDIERFYVYLSCFQDVLDRHKLVQNQVKMKNKDYQFLQQNYECHLTENRRSSTVPLNVIVRSNSSNMSLTDHQPPEDDEKQEDDEHTEKESEEQVEGVVSRSLEQESESDDNMNEKEEETDTDLIHHQTLWSNLESSMNSLNTRLEEFLISKEPWEKMADLYLDLDEWQEDIRERIDSAIKRGEEIFRLNKNPGPLTETYKQFQSEIALKEQSLTELQDLIDNHLTEQLQRLHIAVREFIILHDQLKNKWEQLNHETNDLAEHSFSKMKEWEDKAADCIKRVPELQNKVRDKTAQINNLEEQIIQIQRAPPLNATPPPIPKASCSLWVLKIIFSTLLISLVIISLLVIGFDDNTRKHLSFHLHRSFITPSPTDNMVI